MTRRYKKPTAEIQEKLYTFNVSISFEMSFTFNESQLQPAEEGGENDLDPTDDALVELQNELHEYLAKSYPVENVLAFADFDSLIGISEEPATGNFRGKATQITAHKKPHARQRRKL